MGFNVVAINRLPLRYIMNYITGNVRLTFDQLKKEDTRNKGYNDIIKFFDNVFMKVLLEPKLIKDNIPALKKSLSDKERNDYMTILKLTTDYRSVSNDKLENSVLIFHDAVFTKFVIDKWKHDAKYTTKEPIKYDINKNKIN